MSSLDENPGPTAGRAYMLLCGTTMCWAANAIFGQLAVGEVSPMAMVMFRWVFVVVLMVLFARRHVARDWPVLRRHLWFIGIAGAVGFTLFNSLFYVAAHTTTAVNVGILQGSVPMFVLIGVFLVYRTPVTVLQSVGVVITMVGVAYITAAGDFGNLAALQISPGDGLMIAACVLYAGYTVALRNRPAVSPLGMFTVMALFALLTALPLAAAEAAIGQFQMPSLYGWGVISLVALFPSFLAQIFFIQGVEIIGPSRAGVFVNLVPIFAAIAAVVILGEPFEMFHLAGMALVLGGIWLSEKGKPRAS